MQIELAGGSITATINNSLRSSLRQQVIDERLVLPPEYPEQAQAVRRLYVLIAAYSYDVRGCPWQSPALTASTESLIENFEAFITHIDSMVATQWSMAIRDMLVSAAPPEEQTPPEDVDPTPASAG